MQRLAKSEFDIMQFFREQLELILRQSRENSVSNILLKSLRHI